MKYEKKIAVCTLTAVAISGLMGFTVGRASASDEISETTVPTTVKVIEEVTTEVTTEVPETMMRQTTMPIRGYYDVPLSHDLQDHIRELCEKNDIPMSLIIAMIDVESSFKPNAVSGTNDYGLMQINKINHQRLAKKYGITNILDPYQNVLGGISILAENYNGDLHKSLMAYNLGAAGAKRLWNKGIYNTSYSRTVLSTMEVYKNEIK